MKKLLLSVALVAAGFAANAQLDTLSAHCNATTLYSGVIDDAAPIDSGFIAGNNFYGDLAKMMLFDGTHGVVNGGNITGVAFFTLAKVDAGTGSIQVGIWPDNNGTPTFASPLGITTVTLASIDTSAANTMNLGDGNPFNHVAMFTNPIAIPAGNKFWAGVVLPTGQNLWATAISTPFADGATHSGEIQGNGTFYTFDNGTTATWQLDASMTIYPIVDFVASIQENVIEASVYPNPANDVLNIKIDGTIESVVVTTLDGKVVASTSSNAVNVNELASGMYIYTVKTTEGKIATGNFAKN